MLYILNAVFPTGFGETRRGWTLHEGVWGHIRPEENFAHFKIKYKYISKN